MIYSSSLGSKFDAISVLFVFRKSLLHIIVFVLPSRRIFRNLPPLSTADRPSSTSHHFQCGVAGLNIFFFAHIRKTKPLYLPHVLLVVPLLFSSSPRLVHICLWLMSCWWLMLLSVVECRVLLPFFLLVPQLSSVVDRTAAPTCSCSGLLGVGLRNNNDAWEDQIVWFFTSWLFDLLEY